MHLYLCSLNVMYHSVLAVNSGNVDHWVDVLLILGMQFDVVHVQEVADGYSTPELVSTLTLYGVQGYVCCS